MTHTIAAALACAFAATAAPAEETLREFAPVAIPDAAGPRTIEVLKIESPGITRTRYALAGQVRYDAVEGTGYLEMWSEIPGRGAFFTRSMDGAGAMGTISGSSDWRAFALPFDATGAPPPAKLTVNVVLPGRGKVELGPMRLVQYAPSEDPTAESGAWWGPRTAGLAGGVAGSVIGCIGALIGILAPRGRGRAAILALLKAMTAFGAVCLAAGVAALVKSQPYAVYYPLLLLGSLAFVLPLGLTPVIKRRYEELELRKMTAQDLGTPS